MNEQVLLSVSKILDPPKSPDKLGDFDSSPFLRGASAVLGVSPMSDWRGLGGSKVPKVTAKYLFIQPLRSGESPFGFAKSLLVFDIRRQH
jgi:hypothetical protein